MTTDAQIRLHWYLPSSGEGRPFRQGGTNVVLPDRDSAGPGGFRAPTLSYLTEIALAVEEAGCASVLVPAVDPTDVEALTKCIDYVIEKL